MKVDTERSREAISTIKGYYYQFDYYILQLFKLRKDTDSVCIEGIEDVDILSSDVTTAVQCKYYDGTKCTPSIIGQAIRPMLQHFAKHNGENYFYRLYGHYSSGIDCIQTPLSVDYVKKKFFTFSENKVYHELHDELKLSDDDIRLFLKHFDLKLSGDTYEKQIENIVTCIREELKCDDYDARYFYYNNAVSFVKKTAVKKTRDARTITKKKFLSAIKTKNDLFDKWLIEYEGFEKFYKAARKCYFTANNISPKHRFFLIECDNSIEDREIANIVREIGDKWSRLSQREKTPFCPYIYLHKISSSRLLNIKNILGDDDIHIWDGHEYKDAEFSPKSLARPVNYYVGVKVKILNKITYIDALLKECNGERQLFQFYLEKQFYKNKSSCYQKEFLIQNTNDILKIV